MRYEIVRYDETFKGELLRLLRGHWGPSENKNAAYFEWKYAKNPYIDRPLIYLARHGDEIVGMRGHFGTKWRFEDASPSVIIPTGSDTFVHPSHRKHGAFGQITRYMLEDLAELNYPCVMNLSAGPATHIQSLLMGWRCLGVIDPWQRRAPEPSRPVRMQSPSRPRSSCAVIFLQCNPRSDIVPIIF